MNKEIYEGFSLPAHFVVCYTCNGNGKESGYLGAFTQDDMDEMGEDFLDDYMNGNYDRTCQECNGKRVVLEVDEDQLTDAQRKLYKEWEADEYDRASEARYFDRISAYAEGY